MNLAHLFFTTVFAAGLVIAQSGRSDLPALLSFETPMAGHLPRGWSGGPAKITVADGQIVHSGKHSIRIERYSASPGPFTPISTILPADFEGRLVELRGFIKTEGVVGKACLWIRADGEGGMLSQ